ncbi:hypothetical protein SMCF_1805, partial [Streptomyces coelicoflavus ZG0656]
LALLGALAVSAAGGLRRPVLRRRSRAVTEGVDEAERRSAAATEKEPAGAR